MTWEGEAPAEPLSPCVYLLRGSAGASPSQNTRDQIEKGGNLNWSMLVRSVPCLLVLLLARATWAEEQNLAELMPRIPPKTIAEALQSFKLQHGFSLELVAAEPDVVDPIDAAFDERGRMYVVEMNDYPFLPEQRAQKYRDQRNETWGRIRLLTDTDGDGRMDKSVVFADTLRWPQSVCCSRGGVFVIAPPTSLHEGHR